MKPGFIFLFSILSLFATAQKAELVKTFSSITGRPVSLVGFAPSGKTIMGGDDQGYLFFWDTETGSLTRILRAQNEKINDLSLSSDGKFLATCGIDSIINLWDFENESKISTIKLRGIPSFVLYSPDRSALFFSCGNILYKLLVANFRYPVKTYRGTEEINDAVIFAGSQEITFGSGGMAYRQGLLTGNITGSVELCSDTIVSLDFEADRLACRCKGGATNVINTTDNKTILTFDAGPGPGEVALSHNGAYLVSANHENEAQVWKISAHKPVAFLKGHQAAVRAAAFSPDDQYIATGSEDGTVKIWKFKDDEQSSTAKSGELENRMVEEQNTVNISQPSMDIYVWDSENVDGDIISLRWNGEWVLREYALTKTRKKLELHLQQGKNQLILYAHNLGNDGPNTAAISFMEGNKERTIELNSDLGKCGAINFFYK